MTSASRRVEVFTDGACSGNPGPGGWAALLRWGAHEKELSGGETHTTNNRMELMAALQALAAIKPGASICLTTDSQYVHHGITRWIVGWKKRGWRTAGRKPVLNEDLWRELDALVARHQPIDWCWVRGHDGHQENERVDALARAAIPFSRE